MDLSEKIRKIESLIAASKHDGERQAAELAKIRLLERHQQLEAAKPIEYNIPLANFWKKKLFLALCSKYQIKSYRYKRQKHTTVMLRAPKDLVENILWPEYLKYSSMLEELVQDVIEDLISKIHNVTEDEIVIAAELPPAV
jgi:hypothetical protein